MKELVMQIYVQEVKLFMEGFLSLEQKSPNQLGQFSLALRKQLLQD